MKNTFLQIAVFVILFTNSIALKAQLRVGSSEWCDALRLTELEYSRLKVSTVYFIVPNYLTENRDEFTKLVKESWTYCDIEVIEGKEFSKYENMENSAFISMKVFFFNKIFSHIEYQMWQRKLKKDKMRDREDDFFGSFQLLLGEKSKKLLDYKQEDKAMKIISEEELDIINFKPGLVASYLKTIDFGLREHVSMCGGDRPKPMIKPKLFKMQEDTLYITEDLINEGDKFTEDEFLKIYPYPYRFISMEQLEAMLLKNREIYYYISHAYVTVCNSETGELLYWTRNWIPRVKKKEISELAKAIKGKN
jgi:hypothetical protein